MKDTPGLAAVKAVRRFAVADWQARHTARVSSDSLIRVLSRLIMRTVIILLFRNASVRGDVRLQMPIKPIGKLPGIPEHCRPTMLPARMNNQLDLGALLDGAFAEPF